MRSWRILRSASARPFLKEIWGNDGSARRIRVYVCLCTQKFCACLAFPLLPRIFLQERPCGSAWKIFSFSFGLAWTESNVVCSKVTLRSYINVLVCCVSVIANYCANGCNINPVTPLTIICKLKEKPMRNKMDKTFKYLQQQFQITYDFQENKEPVIESPWKLFV